MLEENNLLQTIKQQNEILDQYREVNKLNEELLVMKEAIKIVDIITDKKNIIVMN